MRDYLVKVTLKSGDVFHEEMKANTYEDVCLQVKEKCFDANELALVEAVELTDAN